VWVVSERAKRIGRNEAILRQVNEQVEGLNETFATLTDRMVIVCECGDESCMEQIEISRGEYESLRSDPILFAVRPGHELADVEDVVSRHEGYHIVAKRPGVATRIAKETDLRGSDDRSAD
jgi:hypothetical protein